MRTNILLLFVSLLSIKAFTYQLETTSSPSSIGKNEQNVQVCEGNRFKYISTYALGRQNDLNLTFTQMQKSTHVDKVVYKQQIYRTYTIFDFKMDFAYSQANQVPPITILPDKIKITGGSLRISYDFKWQKKQLSGSLQGTGKGAVRTDPITFIKSLGINTDTKTFEWKYESAENITITNSLTMSEFKPYKDTDYDVVNEMLNELKSKEPTVKSKLLEALNANFTKILAKFVHENNDTWKEPQKIYYDYNDPHGSFSVAFDNIMLSFTLDQGLDLLLSQSIQNDSKFDCGEKVPTKYKQSSGGLQQFISNALFKSTLLNAMNKGFLNVVLTEQFWQSPAFQFYMGDVHDIIPATKNISSLEPITGKCKTLPNQLTFGMNSTKYYQVSVNFTCDLNFTNNTKKLIGIDITVNYLVEVVPLASTLDFVVRSITGIPNFIQVDEYKIKNMDLALFMVEQTLKMAKNAKVLGSGFKVMTRKTPKVTINQKFMFLQDLGTKLETVEREMIQTQDEPIEVQESEEYL